MTEIIPVIHYLNDNQVHSNIDTCLERMIRKFIQKSVNR